MKRFIRPFKIFYQRTQFFSFWKEFSFDFQNLIIVLWKRRDVYRNGEAKMRLLFWQNHPEKIKQIIFFVRKIFFRVVSEVIEYDDEIFNVVKVLCEERKRTRATFIVDAKNFYLFVCEVFRGRRSTIVYLRKGANFVSEEGTYVIQSPNVRGKRMKWVCRQQKIIKERN